MYTMLRHQASRPANGENGKRILYLSMARPLQKFFLSEFTEINGILLAQPVAE